MTRVEPSSLIICFRLKSLSTRVTVSREAPIICAISSWVSTERTRISRSPLPLPGVQESNSLANFPAEERRHQDLLNVVTRVLVFPANRTGSVQARLSMLPQETQQRVGADEVDPTRDGCTGRYLISNTRQHCA